MDCTQERLNSLERQRTKLDEKIGKLRDRLIRIKGTDVSWEMRLEEEIAELEGLRDQVNRERSQCLGLDTQSGKGIIQEKLKEFQENYNRRVGLIDRINIDREQMLERFWDAYSKLEDDNPFQFYFVTACPTQMPPSFSERLIFEFVTAELDDDDSALYCPRQDDSDRVQRFKLPHGPRDKHCIREFREFFSELFEFSQEQDFDSFIATGIPRLEYKSVALVFYLPETKWKTKVMRSYLEWLIETFSNTHEEVPRFLLFFVFYLEDLHRREMPHELVDTLDALEEQYPAAVHLSPLKPVPKKFVKSWLIERGMENDGNMERLIELLANSLDKKDQDLYQKNQEFNMDDLERFQTAVCDFLEER